MKETESTEDAGGAGAWKTTVVDVGASLSLGLGLILVVSPAFFAWLIHGNSDRYLWIINGPPPFDQFGGGPFQLWTLGALPVLGGLALIAVGLFVRRHIRR